MLEVLEVLKAMCRVLLRMLEVVEGVLCLLEVFEVLEALKAMRRVLLCMLETVEGKLCLLEAPEVVCCVTLCAGGDATFAPWMLEAVEGELCFLEVMRWVLRCMLEAVDGGLCLEVLEGDALTGSDTFAFS